MFDSSLASSAAFQALGASLEYGANKANSMEQNLCRTQNFPSRWSPRTLGRGHWVTR